MIEAVEVRASASVDMVKFGTPPTWEVTVWGEEPHDCRRTYIITAKSDNEAAFEGISQFIDEMQNLDSANEED